MNKIINSYLSIQDWERTANKNGNTRFVNVIAVRRTEISEGTKLYQELYCFENVLRRKAPATQALEGGGAITTIVHGTADYSECNRSENVFKKGLTQVLERKKVSASNQPPLLLTPIL